MQQLHNLHKLNNISHVWGYLQFILSVVLYREDQKADTIYNLVKRQVIGLINGVGTKGFVKQIKNKFHVTNIDGAGC